MRREDQMQHENTRAHLTEADVVVLVVDDDSRDVLFSLFSLLLLKLLAFHVCGFSASFAERGTAS